MRRPGLIGMMGFEKQVFDGNQKFIRKLRYLFGCRTYRSAGAEGAPDASPNVSGTVLNRSSKAAIWKAQPYGIGLSRRRNIRQSPQGRNRSEVRDAYRA
jgi:hypothetical protein